MITTGSVLRVRYPVNFRSSYDDFTNLQRIDSGWVLVMGDPKAGFGIMQVPVVSDFGVGFVTYTYEDSLEDQESWMKRKKMFLKGIVNLGQSLKSET